MLAGLEPNGLLAVLVVVFPNEELNTEEVVVVVVPKPNPEEVEAGWPKTPEVAGLEKRELWV